MTHAEFDRLGRERIAVMAVRHAASSVLQALGEFSVMPNCRASRHVPHQPAGSVGLIHLESHFTDENAGRFRAATYRRLRRHWQFINELKLFEIQDQKRYGINVYSGDREPNFLQAASLYHPTTVEASLKHDGSGSEPGIKDLDGHWDLRPHSSRIVHVDTETLASWHAVLETDIVPVEQTRMVYAVNRSTAEVLEKLAAAPRMSALGLHFSPGWHEKNDRTKGYFDSEWGVPEAWDLVILQGPHIFVATPAYKQPNPTMLNHLDWTEVDLESLPADAMPATSYKPRGERSEYDAAYTQWKLERGASVTPARQHYRVAWRKMAANTGERTLIPAIVPPGVAHIDGVFSADIPNGAACELTLLGAALSSLLADFLVRVSPKFDIRDGVISRLPSLHGSPVGSELALRYLRLNCLTGAYAALWNECFDSDFRQDHWTSDDGRIGVLGDVPDTWSPSVPIRNAQARRQALVELDAGVALTLGITADELCTIYRTQFPVLYGYDTRGTLYDANGRIAPTSVLTAWRKKHRNGGVYAEGELSEVHPGSSIRYDYETPISVLDREADMRTAYEEFARRAATRT